MLAELAAANAAFAVIKAALANGKELVDVGSKALEYFDAKAAIQERATQKAGGRPIEGRSDLEEFMALEKLRQQEEHLREQMIYAGRPGMWPDWLQFQAKAARAKREAKEAAEKAARIRKQKLQALLQLVGYVLLVLLLWAAVMFGVWIVVSKK